MSVDVEQTVIMNEKPGMLLLTDEGNDFCGQLAEACRSFLYGMCRSVVLNGLEKPQESIGVVDSFQPLFA